MAPSEEELELAQLERAIGRKHRAFDRKLRQQETASQQREAALQERLDELQQSFVQLKQEATPGRFFCPTCGDERTTLGGLQDHEAGHIVEQRVGLTEDRFPKIARRSSLEGHPHKILQLIQDADKDTKIQVEESADEDMIRFDAGGNEVMIINSAGSWILRNQLSSISLISLAFHKSVAGGTVGNNQTIGSIRAFPHDGAGFDIGARIDFLANEAHTATNHGQRFEIYTVPNGSVTATLALTVEHDQSVTFSAYAKLLGLRFNAPTELTISSGAVARTQTVHVIDTESDDATDVLDNVTGGTVGDWLLLSTVNSARDVTITNGAGGNGQFLFGDGQDAVLDNTTKSILFRRGSADVWVDIARNFSRSATATVEGVVELATTAEINTGSDSSRAMPVDQYVASLRNVRFIQIRLVASGTDVATGTTIEGDWVCPFTGTLLQDDNHKELLMAYNDTAGTTGTMVVDIHKGGTTIMTTNKLDIETGEKNTRDATTQPDLTTTAVTKGDIFTFDFDAVHTTKAKGLTVAFAIRLT